MAAKRTSEILAQNVRRMRKDRGWTQADLADALGWQPQRVSQVELSKKKFWIDVIDEICGVFQVTQAELLEQIGEPQETAA